MQRILFVCSQCVFRNMFIEAIEVHTWLVYFNKYGDAPKTLAYDAV